MLSTHEGSPQWLFSTDVCHNQVDIVWIINFCQNTPSPLRAQSVPVASLFASSLSRTLLFAVLVAVLVAVVVAMLFASQRRQSLVQLP